MHIPEINIPHTSPNQTISVDMAIELKAIQRRVRVTTFPAGCLSEEAIREFHSVCNRVPRANYYHNNAMLFLWDYYGISERILCDS